MDSCQGREYFVGKLIRRDNDKIDIAGLGVKITGGE
jgi:hypothetical protein